MLPSYHPLQARALVRPSRVQHPVTGQWVEVGCPPSNPHLSPFTLTVPLTPTLAPSLWIKVGCQRVWDTQQIYGVAMSRSFGDCQCHPFIISVRTE